jgi:hypothetical protein
MHFACSVDTLAPPLEPGPKLFRDLLDIHSPLTILYNPRHFLDASPAKMM